MPLIYLFFSVYSIYHTLISEAHTGGEKKKKRKKVNSTFTNSKFLSNFQEKHPKRMLQESITVYFLHHLILNTQIVLLLGKSQGIFTCCLCLCLRLLFSLQVFPFINTELALCFLFNEIFRGSGIRKDCIVVQHPSNG